MKILQLIDSLNPGGAEKMALNYYKQLEKNSVESHIMVTREKGLLAEDILDEPTFHYLNKKSIFDISAFLKLRRFIISEEIELIHAHSSSWFFAVLCKISGLDIKLIWHDHYGNSNFLGNRNIQPLRFFSKYFDGVISVTRQLQSWSIHNLRCENYVLLPNFIVSEINEIKKSSTDSLLGVSKFKIGCVANLRPQKDHSNLLKAFNILKEDYDVTLHLFGKNFHDDYSRNLISKFNQDSNIYYYGEKNDILDHIRYLDIAVLSSRSEGLPLALLEYGKVGLPVVCTDVGECKSVINSNGLLVERDNAEAFAEALKYYIENPEKRMEQARNYSSRIEEKYSKDNVISLYIKFCEELC